LLWVSEAGGSGQAHAAAHDGNGNVMALLNLTSGTETARYEYGPFGETARITGTFAKDNSFRFSTKYQDAESDLYYYGYRYYNATTGRWPNRDPLEEKGGVNLYEFVRNNPISMVDPDGRNPVIIGGGVIIVGGGTGYVGFCINRALCRQRINLAFGFAEAQAHANAPDESVHRRTSDPTRPVVEGGDADTLTHCIASCDVAKNPGFFCGGLDRALFYLQDREVGNAIGTQLDRLNNEMGFALGMSNPANCTDACLDWLRRGLLYEIRNGQIVPSSVE
jgi:RHS repeat-associated protein